MSSKKEKAKDIVVAPTHDNTDSRRSSRTDADSLNRKEKKSPAKAFGNFLYDPRGKTVLGRGALNWAKLAAFYTALYFFMGCFFAFLVYVFAATLDRVEPRYHNTESTMAVRSTSAVVGLGFRPQPAIDTSLIRITDDPKQQKIMASSLRLFRDVFLLQNNDARAERCSLKEPAAELPPEMACLFNWFHIVQNQDHPCSDNNLYGFRHEQPCVLIKLNKVYGWAPIKGALPMVVQNHRGIQSNRSVLNSDVYITCAGTNVADNDILTKVTYYSVEYPSGSSNVGVIPNYFFPYRNAKDHVQPFVLVQFNKLPLNRLVSITCRAWAPGIEHDLRRQRGLVTFQMYRTSSGKQSDDKDDD